MFEYLTSLSGLKSYADLVLPLFFVCFFLAALVAIRYNRNGYVRKTYISGFFVLLLVMNLTGPQVLPLTQWHKFSDPYPQTYVDYELRVVDAGGNELDYDYRATLAADGVTLRLLEEEMLAEHTDAKNERVACYLLRRARVYRTRLSTRSPFHLIRFPPHGLGSTWFEGEISEYERFTGIRLYRINITTSADGTEITSYSEHAMQSYPSPCTGLAKRNRAVTP
jgi:hypothetical protein